MAREIEKLEDKINNVVANTILNGLPAEANGETYDYMEEAIEWGTYYFPTLNKEKFLELARGFDVWRDFESACELNE